LGVGFERETPNDNSNMFGTSSLALDWRYSRQGLAGRERRREGRGVRSQRAKEWRCESVLLCASGTGKGGGWEGGALSPAYIRARF
jgi:hypothetical protein